MADINSTLGKIYRGLVRSALSSGDDQGRTLRNGARLAVRIRNGVQIVTFSRRDVELGGQELVTFLKHCQVPPGAERIPTTGQSQIADGERTRYYVAYRWPLTSDMFRSEASCDATS